MIIAVDGLSLAIKRSLRVNALCFGKVRGATTLKVVEVSQLMDGACRLQRSRYSGNGCAMLRRFTVNMCWLLDSGSGA